MADRDRCDEQPSSRPAHPPPPHDPFARYQTPWPRDDKDEQNPFVQFRRFADEQFQSIFSGVPKIFTAFSAGASAGADAFQREIDQMMQRRQEFEEGFRKQFEQDIEEQRQASKFEEEFRKQLHSLERQKLWHEQQIQEQPHEEQAAKPETSRSPWWQSGRAAECPALNEMQSEDARKCPAMYNKDGKPKTELDAYQIMQAAQIGDDTETAILKTANDALWNYREERTRVEQQDKKPKKSNRWLSSVGWDGNQREQNSTPPEVLQDYQMQMMLREQERHRLAQAKSAKTEGPITTMSRFTSRWSRPFDNPHDTIPWLLVNQYSPVFLCNPNQPRVGHVKLQQGVNQPFRIVDTFYIPRGFFQFNDRREELAKQLPWADAFEDLVSLKQTGKMVDRDYSTNRTPKTWIHDMVQRGSLGPTWGFNEQGQLTKMARESRDQKAETIIARQNDAIPEFFPPPPTPEDIIAAGVIATTSIAEHEQKQTAGDIDRERSTLSAKPSLPTEELAPPAISAPTESSWSSTTWSSSATEMDYQKSDSVISSTTTTERWTKPDGTVETRRVFKRRFSDGHEIEEETHDFEEPKKPELRHAISLEQAPWPVGPRETTQEPTLRGRSSNKQTQTTTPVQDELKKEKGRGGWFWN